MALIGFRKHLSKVLFEKPLKFLLNFCLVVPGIKILSILEAYVFKEVRKFTENLFISKKLPFSFDKFPQFFIAVPLNSPFCQIHLNLLFELSNHFSYPFLPPTCLLDLCLSVFANQFPFSTRVWFEICMIGFEDLSFRFILKFVLFNFYFLKELYWRV